MKQYWVYFLPLLTQNFIFQFYSQRVIFNISCKKLPISGYKCY